MKTSNTKKSQAFKNEFDNAQNQVNGNPTGFFKKAKEWMVRFYDNLGDYGAAAAAAIRN